MSLGPIPIPIPAMLGLLKAAAPIVGVYAAIKQATASAPSAPSAEDIVRAQEKAAKESTLKPQMSQGEASITAAEIARETAARRRRRSGYMSTLLTTGGMQLGLGNQASVSKKTLLGA